VIERLLTANQLADILGTRKNTVYELAASGKIPSHKVPGVGRRFKEAEILEWLEQCREPREPKKLRRSG
jgi:excisionase family DNA binding protein